MDDYKDIETLEEFVGFLYGMVAGNHDIDTIFIDGALKQADITLNSLPDFLHAKPAPPREFPAPAQSTPTAVRNRPP